MASADHLGIEVGEALIADSNDAPIAVALVAKADDQLAIDLSCQFIGGGFATWPCAVVSSIALLMFLWCIYAM